MKCLYCGAYCPQSRCKIYWYIMHIAYIFLIYILNFSYLSVTSRGWAMLTMLNGLSRYQCDMLSFVAFYCFFLAFWLILHVFVLTNESELDIVSAMRNRVLGIIKIAATASGSCRRRQRRLNTTKASGDAQSDWKSTNILWRSNFRNCDIHCMNCSRGNSSTRVIQA